MIANHIHDALGQVDRMRDLILERRRFHGYSGTARMLGGGVALAVTFVLDRVEALHTPLLQLMGGSGVLAAGVICLLAPGIVFLNPWPMGLIFFTGEMVGGWILRSGNSVGSDQWAEGSMAEEETSDETTC
jgi:hypothetical protein